MKRFIALLGISAAVLFSTDILAWETGIVGTAKFSFGYGLAVKVDAAGSVVAAGALSSSGGDLDFIVLKFGANGSELWRKAIRGTASGPSLATTNEAKALAIAGDGSIAAAGFMGNTGTGGDFTVVKLDTNGNELWRRAINGSANGDDEARAVSFDAAGNIVAAGLSANGSTGKDLLVVKFDASGNELWRYVLNGTANGDDQANALALDGAGNVFAAGFLTNSGTGSDFAVVKLSGANGAELWRRVVNGAINAADFANAIAVDAAGNVFAVGQILNGRDPNDPQISLTTMIVKFDGASGNELWRDSNRLAFVVGSTVHGNAVTIDSSGNPVLVGQSFWNDHGDVHRSMAVQKNDGASGAVLFRQGFGDSPSADAFSLALDAAANIYVAGYLRASLNPAETRDFTVIKVPASGGGGFSTWSHRITANGTADAAFGVAVDGAGNAIAAGTVQSVVGGVEANAFTVAKLDAATGGELWTQFLTGSAGAGLNGGLGVAIDSAGDILAAGYLQNTAVHVDFSVAKLDRNTGDEVWRSSINGDAGNDEQALAIAVDGAGNAIAAGYVVNQATGQDFAVAKFDGASGAELWRKFVDSDGGSGLRERANAVAVDAQGNIFVAGLLAFSANSFTLMKLNGATGAEIWRQMSSGGGEALALAIDSAGDVAVTGNAFMGGTGNTTVVMKINGATGGILWRQDVGVLRSTAEAHAIAVDPAGNIVAGGFITTSGGSFTTVIKYNGATGAEIWRSSSIAATHIAVGGGGSVALAGGSAGDFAVSKLDGATGTELWRRVINGSSNGTDDFARQVAVDALGDVFAVGSVMNQNTGSDVLLVKLDRGSGAEIWRKEIDGSLANSFDQGWGLVLDSAGNVAAVGATEETGTGSAFTVVMLNGADGSDFTGDTPPPVASASQDIGSVGAAGSTSYSNGTFTVRASGSDIWNTADGFRFAYQSFSGDGEIVAHVVSLGNSDPWAKAGVMIRETLAAGSKHAMMGITPGNGTTFLYRVQTDGSSASQTPFDGLTAPYWVKLVRAANTLTGYKSTDGVNWVQVGSQTITMPANVYIGLAVSSHNNSASTTATFDNVSITAGASVGGPQAVVWVNPMNVIVNGNNLQENCGGCGDSGAQSHQTIASGSGYVEFTASETTTQRAIGLSRGNTDNSRGDIDYAIMLWNVVYGGNKIVEIYENDVYKWGPIPYTTGDVFRIAVENGQVKYSKNGTVFYTSANAPAFPLLVDSSLFTPGSTLTNAVISAPQLVN